MFLNYFYNKYFYALIFLEIVDNACCALSSLPLINLHHFLLYLLFLASSDQMEMNQYDHHS